MPRFVASALIALAALGSVSVAQTAYKYRDADGHWVFTDQKAGGDVAQESFRIGHDDGGTLRIVVERVEHPQFSQWIASNDCLCVVTFLLTIKRSEFPDIPEGAEYPARLEPKTRQLLVQTPHSEGKKPELTYSVKAAIGTPEAVHSPALPYRVPFSVGSTFRISQAFPSRVTHTSPDSQYAVDIAMPDGTPVYAARDGVVINARHDSFRGAANPLMLDQANVIDVLHEDGTIAVYAHLHWDSVRVHIGQRVMRGEYLANSGNTGFSSGPHLHFAVIRNAGLEDVSVPLEFAGSGGTAATPVDHGLLTAY